MKRKKHAVRYIAGLPTALCGAQPSQIITLVKHNATAAEAAPVPRACIDRRSWRRPEAQNMQEQLQLHSAIRSYPAHKNQ